MSDKLKIFLMRFIGIGLVLFLATSFVPVKAHETTLTEIKAYGQPYIYIYNKTDGSPDRLTIVDPVDPDVLEYFCSIKGILKVTLNGTEYTCDPK